MVYQGPGNQVGNYFYKDGESKSKNRNPCDFFMRELSINYPKKKEDEEKNAHYNEKYRR